MALTVADAPPAVLPRRRQLLFGTALISGAAGVYLMTLLGVYLQARESAGDSWLSQNTVPLTQPTMQLFTLLLGCFTVQWAVSAISEDARGYAYLALGLTVMMGVAFLNQTWFLFTEVGLRMGQNEGKFFYTLTGSHVAMVGAATIFVAVTALRALGGSMSSRHPDGISAAALFWYVTTGLYFVVWLGVYVAK